MIHIAIHLAWTFDSYEVGPTGHVLGVDMCGSQQCTFGIIRVEGWWCSSCFECSLRTPLDTFGWRSWLQKPHQACTQLHLVLTSLWIVRQGTVSRVRTPEMLGKARENAKKDKVENVLGWPSLWRAMMPWGWLLHAIIMLLQMSDPFRSQSWTPKSASISHKMLQDVHGRSWCNLALKSSCQHLPVTAFGAPASSAPRNIMERWWKYVELIMTSWWNCPVRKKNIFLHQMKIDGDSEKNWDNSCGKCALVHQTRTTQRELASEALHQY
jgi:hypothetical protein